MLIDRTVTVASAIDDAFAYLKDFTTTEQWEPGTVRTKRISGEGGIGTCYHNVSRFLGRETELRYVVEELDPPRHLHLRGTNATVVSDDTITLRPTPDGGTEVRYRAEFSFRGVARILGPLLTPAFKRLGDNAEKGLRAALS